MPEPALVSQEAADRLAWEWIAAWNAHQLGTDGCIVRSSANDGKAAG